MISSNTRHSVAFKLAATALFSLLVVLLATMGIVSGLLWKDFGRLSRDDATQYAAQVRTLVQTFDETAQEQAKRDFSLFKANFPGQFSVAEAPGADGKPEAVLSFQGAAVNGDFEVVDRFSKDSMGAVATIFARTGEDFIRVTTSLKKQDGERAYKTLLDRKHPAYALMNEGKTYIGRASLFGREYMTVYEPIREGNRTIGILFIGSDMGAILGKLDTVMAGQKLFATGAVYAVNLSAGPARATFLACRARARPSRWTKRTSRPRPGWRRWRRWGRRGIWSRIGPHAAAAKVTAPRATWRWSITSPGIGPSWPRRP